MTKSLVLEKAIKFALRVVKLARYLSEEKSEYVLSKQILLSGTHVAKFIKDATNAESRQFFAGDMRLRLKRLPKPSFGFSSCTKAAISTTRRTLRLTKTAWN